MVIYYNYDTLKTENERLIFMIPADQVNDLNFKRLKFNIKRLRASFFLTRVKLNNELVYLYGYI